MDFQMKFVKYNLKHEYIQSGGDTWYSLLLLYLNIYYSTLKKIDGVNQEIDQSTLNDISKIVAKNLTTNGNLNKDTNKILKKIFLHDDVNMFKYLEKYIITHDNDPKPIYIAIYNNANKCIDYMLKNLKINYLDMYNNFSLPAYALHNKVDKDLALQILNNYVNAGGEYDWKSIDGNNFLHYAARNSDYEDICRILNERVPGLKNSKNRHGKYPANYCIFENNCNIVRPTTGKINNDAVLTDNNLIYLIDTDFPKIRTDAINIPIKITSNGVNLGSGGFGSTKKVTIDGKEYALKIQTPCFARKHPFIELCKYSGKIMKEGFVPYKITTNKLDTYVVYPAFITEALIAHEINLLIKNNTCHNFYETFSLFINAKEIFTTMELLDGSIKQLLNGSTLNIHDYTNILIQLFYGIYVLNTINVSHNDIHYGNIMYKKIRSPIFSVDENKKINDYKINGISTENIKYFEFCVDGINVKIQNRGYIIKIIDYGLAFIDKIYNNVLYKIRPSYILKLDGNFTNKEVNRNIDIGNLCITFMTEYKTSERSANLMLCNNVVRDEQVKTMCNNLFNKIIGQVEIHDPKISFRIRKSALHMKMKEYSEIINIIINEYNNLNKDPEINLFNSDNTPRIIFNIMKSFYNTNFNTYLCIPIINDFNVQFKLTENIKCSNIYLSDTFGNTGEQYINVVIFSELSKLKLSTECCNISGPGLLDGNKNNTVVTINGSFFDIHSTLKPLGIYKDENYIQIDNEIIEIPEVYKSMYYIMCWNKLSDIKFIKYDTFKNDQQNKYKFITCVAPMIYMDNDGKQYSLTKYMNTFDKSTGADPFYCEIDNDINGKYTGNMKLNCNKILPGELSHGKSRNPRSMMIITKTNEIVFIVIEGRGQRGSGMTFMEMEELSKKFNPKYVIGLDGGRSSHLTIKTKNVSSVIMNPTYKLFSGEMYPLEKKYPVGNLLVMTDTA